MFLLPFTVLIEIQPNTSNTIANRFTRLENDLHKMEYKHVCHWPCQLRSLCIQPLHHEQHFEQGECNIHYQMQYLEQLGSCRWDLSHKFFFNWLEYLLYIGNTLICTSRKNRAHQCTSELYPSFDFLWSGPTTEINK